MTRFRYRTPLQSVTSVWSLPFLIIMAMLGGCATPATFEGMVPSTFDVVQRHPGTVNVKVTGGQETSAMWKTQISNEAFTQALVESINKTRIFSKVIQGTGVDYLLLVNIVSIEQPSFGASFTVNLEAGWTLIRADNGVKVWQEAVKSDCTASMGDAFVGAKRLRLATEGAARNNISKGLAKISRLDL